MYKNTFSTRWNNLGARCAVAVVVFVWLFVFAFASKCEPGCEERGNCNAEEGRCECPWGFDGPRCEVDLMTACRQTKDDPGSCGFAAPKNCECFRSCYRVYCNQSDSDVDKCAHEWGHWARDSPCFLRTDLPPQQPYGSLITDDILNRSTWYQQIPEIYGKNEYQDDMKLKDMSLALVSPMHRPGVVWRQWNHKALPLHHCPNNCSNGRGVCIHFEGRDKPECKCHMGFNGTDCSTPEPDEACWFSPNCGGRGTCISGFCHCRPGYWGVGCHRSVAHQQPAAGVGAAIGEAGGGLVGPRSRLKVYMYELPWQIAFPWEMAEWAHTRDPMYTAYEFFLTYFLADNTTRTENPWDADLFYIPALVFFYQGNVRTPQPQLDQVISYIRAKWPFYDRRGGRDHFVFLTGDRGACPIERQYQDTLIKLVHFGMQRANLPWNDMPNQDYACVQQRRDLVVPPCNLFPDLKPYFTEDYYNKVVAAGGGEPDGRPPRSLLFFFAGGVGDGIEYSGGARKAIHTMLKALNPAPQDVLFVEGHAPGYRDLLFKAKFCISPFGFGWGLRLIQAIEYGCIPVIIQDFVYQPFEDFLPYEEFSVRLPMSDVPRLVEILRSYTDEDVVRLRLGMAKHYRAFIWNREFGGTAYEWTLAGLQRRLFTALHGDMAYDVGEGVRNASGTATQRRLRG